MTNVNVLNFTDCFTKSTASHWNGTAVGWLMKATAEAYPSPSSLFVVKISRTFEAKICGGGFSSIVSFKRDTAHLANCSPSYKIHISQLSITYALQIYTSTSHSDNSCHYILPHHHAAGSCTHLGSNTDGGGSFHSTWKRNEIFLGNYWCKHEVTIQFS